MGKADNPAGAAGQSPVSLLIVGGGIMGLWAAVKAERLGIDTLLVDAGRLGQGASGGLLGALMAHMPDRWSDKKQYQFDALVSLEREIATLEAATGLDAGYRRCGRLIPMAKPQLREAAIRQHDDAALHWRAGERAFDWNVEERPTLAGWPSAEFTEYGLIHDTLAARVAPRKLVAMLIAFLKQANHVHLVEGAGLQRIEAEHGEAQFSDGRVVHFGHCIVSAGHRSFPLLAALGPEPIASLGQAVKGQATLLRADVPADLPLIFRGGLYVVPHGDGTVAIGSTSENSFDHPLETDAQLDGLLDDARKLVPLLADAPVIERWAGLRPKAIGRDPMVGPHPAAPRIIALTGGFKVSFGLAHHLADAALSAVCGRQMPVPQSFLLASHIELDSR